MDMAWVERGRSGFQQCGSVRDNMRPGLCKWLGGMDERDFRVGSDSIGMKEVSVADLGESRVCEMGSVLDEREWEKEAVMRLGCNESGWVKMNELVRKTEIRKRWL
ncbi:hypothetical protein MRB53_009664 [Persea americana]|uniref:Uncharacterized protein n=1 Tax=Persea americana TaxID=3435 RepID=A0ACC2LPP5_PERAE|nr:hypothetical protein MRB53_009664 [Persea americana]